MKYPASELVLNAKNQVYHLGISPEQLAEKVILVGDQNRVNLIADFFDSIEHRSQHREFFCCTGTYKNKRITALSTGIGTDNVDIVLNELDALVNIDLTQRKEKNETKSLDLVRIGTCGILKNEIPIHSYLLSTHALGLDNIAHFYKIDFSTEENNLLSKIEGQVQFPFKVLPYVAEASNELIEKLASEKTVQGITVTSSGFYGPQGRQLRLKNRVDNFEQKLGNFQDGNHTIINFEMESSALFALGKALGHRCATICLGIANRSKMEFSQGHQKEMLELIKYVLERI